MEGHTLAVESKGSAVLVFLDKMDKIIEVNEMNGDAVVQAVRSWYLVVSECCYADLEFVTVVIRKGVQWEVLNEHLADRNIPLFFPIE